MEQPAIGPQDEPDIIDLSGQSDFALFESLYPKLRSFAAVVADLDMDPDDLVQDALAATLARHELHELDQPAAYLKRAILNGASNKRTRAGLFGRLIPRLSSPTSTEDHYPSDLSILDQLTPIDRALVYSADVDGLPHAEIAAELGLTSSAVRKRLSRARNQLRRSLGINIASLPGGST